ncbi:MAG: GAF domain-containing sensor histidine kinase [Anaerolineales bacterium]|nr:GAF domain-containing sensor histidine kinase [Anaerolineales bacterium]
MKSVCGRELASLLEISHTLSSTLSSRSLLEVILNQLKIMIDYDSAILFVTVDQSIEVVAYRGELPPERVIGMRMAIENAPGFQEVAALHQVVIVDDVRSDGLLAQKISAAAAASYPRIVEKTRSWMGAPLIIGDRLLGMLRLDHHEPGRFTASDAQLVSVIANHAAIAMENARLYEDARKLATLEERQRMARELHDSVSQALYGIALGTHAAREQLERAPEKLRDTLDYTLALSATAVSEMRALVFELRPDSLEQEGLVAGITRQIDAMRSRTGVEAHLELGDEPPVSLDAKEVLYRISQEALQNIAKHAQATTVCIRLRHDGQQVLLEIADNGRGFDPKGHFPGHLGLKTMHERATRLGGDLKIVSEVGKGTQVQARLLVDGAGSEVVPAQNQPATVNG